MRLWIAALFALAVWACSAPSADEAAADSGSSEEVAPPEWLERPTGADFARHYPPAALKEGIGGRVQLNCIVLADGRLNCEVLNEEPQGHGFGDAALAVAQAFRMAQTSPDGQPTEGGRVRIPLRFHTIP